SHTDPFIVLLILDGETIETTLDHPFYTAERNWVGAGDLAVGEHVRRADGEYGVVRAVEIVGRTQRMYNLTVDEAHTFFVGAQRWLVHNACNWLGGGLTDDPVGNQLVRDAQAYFNSLPGYTKGSATVAATVVDDIKHVAINAGAHPDAISKLNTIVNNQQGVRLVVGQGLSDAGHAERALYNMFSSLDNLKIGISRKAGPCPACQRFFRRENFVNLYWPK
ncbi:MAG: Hint domain-containing protein, partial [Nitrososphaera sp.]